MTSHSGTPHEVSQSNIKDRVAAWIREQIFFGDLTPGTKIDQNKIAEALRVSKQPVREALIVLEAEALIRQVPRRGAFVARLEPEDIRDHYHIYGLMASVSAERAASRLTAQHLDRLRAILLEMNRTDRPELLETLNYEFHKIINEAGASQRLRSVLRQLVQSIPARFYEHTVGWQSLARADHERILTALEVGDGKVAGEAMVAHLLAGGEYLVRVLMQRGFWDRQAERDRNDDVPPNDVEAHTAIQAADIQAEAEAGPEERGHVFKGSGARW